MFSFLLCINAKYQYIQIDKLEEEKIQLEIEKRKLQDEKNAIAVSQGVVVQQIHIENGIRFCI